MDAKCQSCWDYVEGLCEGLSCDPGGCWVEIPTPIESDYAEEAELSGCTPA